VNRIGVRLAAAMLLVAVVSLLAVPIATAVAERAAYERLPASLRDRVETFSRPDPILPGLGGLRRGQMDGMSMEGMSMTGMMQSFEGEAARLAVLVRDLRALRRDAVVAGIAMALAASVALAWLLSRGLARPIEAVSRAASRVAAGDLSARAKVRRPERQPAEVRALAHDFDAMAASLEQLEGERKAMIADVAHELRNPLTTLSLRLEAAADGDLALDREEAATLLSQTQLLSRLVEDLRTLSLADAGRLTLIPEPLDLRGPVRDAAAAHGGAAAHRGVQVVASLPNEPLTVVGDRDRLLQVLHNLLENAVHASPDGAEVTIDAAPDGAQVRVTVRDHGPGIEVEPPEAIFDRFVQGQPRDRRRRGGGSGLGLAIARTLVTLHGGEIFVHRQGEGTEIGFVLTLAAESTVA